MQIQRLSNPAQNIIEGYLTLPFKNQKISAPYYNNKRQHVRGALRVLIGKGSPEDIVEEAHIFSLKEKVDLQSLSAESLKQYLVDHHIGVDCSAFAYYVLNAEFKVKGKGSLSSQLHYNGSFIRKLLTRLRPVENTNVETFWNDKNSTEVSLSDIQPGDMIIMLGTGRSGEMNHIMIVESVEPNVITYVHSLQWSSDGQYNHGVRRGTIRITNPSKNILEQEWTEQGRTASENETFTHARDAADMKIKRLNVLN